jgi:hypothetical protein
MLRTFSLAADRLTTPATFGRRLIIIALVAIVARALTFGSPIVHVDEEFYFVAAQAWTHGALPYVDVWDRKPIGLFLIYLPAAALGIPLGIWVYQAMALASLVATALLIAHLADRAGWRKGALAGALAYVLWVNFVDGQGGQAPIFYNLLIAGAAALIAPREDRDAPRILPGFVAMALVGCALQVKYSVVFEGAFFGLWLLWREWRAGRRRLIAPYGAGLVAVALLPTAASWLAFASIGAGDAWFYANITSILDRRPDPMLEQLGNLLKILLITSPLIAATLLAIRSDGVRTPEARAVRLWLFAWAASAALGLLVFGSWFEHYALPLMVPLATCAAGFFGDHRTGPRVALPVLLLAFVGGQATLLTKRHNRGTPAQFYAVADAIGHGPGCLYVYSGESGFYPASGRCALTRYLFPSHLGRMREEGAIGVDQRAEIARILALKPAIVVLRPAYHGERVDMRALVMDEMHRNYRLRTTRPLGNQTIEIYERRLSIVLKSGNRFSATNDAKTNHWNKRTDSGFGLLALGRAAPLALAAGRDQPGIIVHQLDRVLAVAADLVGGDLRGAAQQGLIAPEQAVDRRCRGLRVARRIMFGTYRIGHLGAAAGIGHDQRQPRRDRFRCDQTERLRFRTVNQRVTARHDPGEALAVIDRAEHADMGGTRDPLLDRAALDPRSEQHQSDRQRRPGPFDRIDHQAPALLGVMPAEAEQQMALGRQVALREESRTKFLVAQRRGEMAAFDAQGHRGVDSHASCPQPLLERWSVRHHRIVIVQKAAHIAAVPREGAFDPLGCGESFEPAHRISRDIVVVHEEHLGGIPLPLPDDPGRPPWRRGLDQVGLDLVEQLDDGLGIPEQPVILVEGQARRLDVDDLAAARAFLDHVLAPGGDDDQLMP